MMPELCGRLLITIAGATGLADCDSWGGASDPYCIIKLDGKEIARTSICKDNESPEWNEEFFINLKGEGEDLSLEVWDYDNMRSDDLLGLHTVPLTSVESTTDSIKSITSDLLTPSGEPAGTLTYSLRFRAFGGQIASETTGNKKSLHIGINYLDLPEGKGRLNGCHNDVETLHGIITEKYGFSSENTRILRDDQDDSMPTRANIEEGITWLVDGASSGDSLIFQFSGHGGQIHDRDGDEEDGKDETLIPCDFRENGMICDDSLFEQLVNPLASGVKLTIIMDCCHSGTGMDLPFVHKVNQEDDDQSFSGFSQNNKTKVVDGEEGGEGSGNSEIANQSVKSFDDTSDATVIMFSGCMDHQTSADATIEGKASGAMTFALKTVLDNTDGDCSYKNLLLQMYDILEKGGYTQVPQLSTACPFDLESLFNL